MAGSNHKSIAGFPQDISGLTFFRLTVLKMIEPARYGRPAKYLCKCSCGNETIGSRTAILIGDKKSCGCWNKELRASQAGKCKSPEYSAWDSMKDRCLNSNHKSYANYGGRGITVCDRWLGADGFANFLEDMGPRTSPQHSLERRKNWLGYAPDNCYWATRSEQNRNRRSTKLLTLGDRTQCVAAWAEELGVSIQLLCQRARRGWPVERILTEPIATSRRNNKCKIFQLAGK